MTKIKKWKDCERDDLSMIPSMLKAGWEIVFSYSDRKYGRITSESVPHEPVEFRKGMKHCWKVGPSYFNGGITNWHVAEQIGDFYSSARKYNTLEEVVTHE